MTLSMFQASIPVFIRRLDILSTLLDKGAAFAAETGMDPAELIEARLAPDMLPFAKQIQIVSDIVKFAAKRLADVDAPSFVDDETSFPELKERLARTADFLRTVPAEAIDGTEDKAIVMRIGGQDMEFTGQAYLLHFVLPNVYFHTTIAYGLMRNKGVPLGKRDYLGGI